MSTTPTTPAPYPWERPEVPAYVGGTAPAPPFVDPTLKERINHLGERKARVHKAKEARCERNYLAELAVNAELAVMLVIYRLDDYPEARRVLEDARNTLVSLYDPKGSPA